MPLPEGLIIRMYEARDNARVWEFHWEGVIGTTRDYPKVDRTYDADLTELEAEYLTAGSNFWVVEGSEGLVGMAAIKRIDEATGRLRRMRVTEAWRRRGVARALLERAIAFCRESGYARLILDTTEHQTAAQRLYESAGFGFVGQRSLGPFRVYDYVLDLG
ncbi:MAG TPA: GNAT family N-acetyltransferase [Dehalococcoidia bacterium]|nr:GNAT family N-acetyltransferase [Dehalococcoidia bacterium]